MASAARLWRRGGCAVRTPLLWGAPKARLGWRRQVASGRRGGGSEVLEQSRFFRRGVAFSALSYLSYEAYILISHSSVVHADVKVNEVLDQADYLYGSGETEKLYQLLEQYKNSENAQLLWRLARASRDVAQLSQTSAEKKKQLIYEALAYATKALEKEKSCFSVHKWYAICLSDVGDYEGIKKKITNAFVIKEHFQKAIELNPKDATSLHLMGIWCYTFADMPWYQSKIAAALFSTPPSSTYEEVWYPNRLCIDFSWLLYNN
ncbi:of microtubule dynamics 1 isoform X1 [Podarcis lilfordi]|uniref:Regulator of microtubule dynamics protein 1 n=1 Tax=Podarcis lilfordi TaxID=74358 RepID=A0AA35KKW1_9SAUR|nr:of microtubule dynamics 1 isoform X1 [Podarcis lilfordi]